MKYEDFLKTKIIEHCPTGLDIKEEDINGKLYLFQRDITKWALNKGKAAVFADCGTGKTPIQLAWSEKVCEHTGGDVLILAPLAVSRQTVHEGKKFGIEVNICRTQADVKPGINITNYEMLQHFNASHFAGVVLDECFPLDTLVDIVESGKIYRRAISEILPGDKILNAGGIDVVTETHKRQINGAVYINANGGIICSKNHPFFTLHGWRCAQNLQPGDYIMETATAMRMVWGNFQTKERWSKNATILRDILFSEMENDTEGNFREGSFSGSSSEEREKEKRMVEKWTSQGIKRIGKNPVVKPDARRINAKESFADFTGHEPQTYRAWGKWKGIDGATGISKKSSFRRMDSGICYFTGETKDGIPNELQSRLRKSRDEDSNRNRRKQSLFKKRTRQKERQYAGFVRVESVEVLEQTSRRLDKYRNKNGNIYFYDIKAKRHPSFSVNGLLVHNSGILKAYTGKTKQAIIEAFKGTQYKLACTATPSPNDHMEILNHAAFLDVMQSHEALAIWFINDTMNMGKYRLKKHAVQDFWNWVSSWAISISKPSDLGYSDEGFILPPLNIIEEIIEVDITKDTGDRLFRVPDMNATSFHKEKRLTAEARAKRSAEIVNSFPEKQFIVWCDTNYEADMLRKMLPEATEIRGSDKADRKEQAALDFVAGKIRVLISKPSIFGFGLNFQHCHKMIFCGLSYSFELFYQAVRRLLRFGQKNPVDCYVVIGETERQLINTIRRKESLYEEMKRHMIDSIKRTQNIKQERIEYKLDYERDIMKGEDWTAILGDCIEETRNIADASVHFELFSPPFSSLYIYSDSYRDMGNVKNDEEFFKNFEYLIPELYRILIPGRLVAVHCKQLVNYKNRDGASGLRDFRGEIIRVFQKHGFVYHSEVCIWKDPVIEMQRTKSHGLLYKQLRKDSSYSRQGLPDYLVVFRKWDSSGDVEPVTKTKEGFPLEIWQRYASPVWFDIQQTNVLNCQLAREGEDEKHIAPLQIDVIERAVELWTNPGDIVFTPFMGIGSECYGALKLGRKALGIELKRSYFDIAVKNLKDISGRKAQVDIFSLGVSQ